MTYTIISIINLAWNNYNYKRANNEPNLDFFMYDFTIVFDIFM